MAELRLIKGPWRRVEDLCMAGGRVVVMMRKHDQCTTSHVLQLIGIGHALHIRLERTNNHHEPKLMADLDLFFYCRLLKTICVSNQLEILGTLHGRS